MAQSYNMAWLRISACFIVVSLLLNSCLAAICPKSCVCSTTRDGLHRATCSNLAELYKYTLRQKHHNVNILDLSHNNITKITHELDKLTEVVTLDLSTNGLTEINKFLHNARKLVHLNLANNRFQKLALVHLPKSVSSLDLTNNLLEDVPSDITHLNSLEHLELEGNPLHCSCDNVIARDHLLSLNVYIDDVKCQTPLRLKGRSWLELKTKDICKAAKSDFMDMMMGDQPIDAVRIGEETSALKSMSLVSGNDLEDGSIIHGEELSDDDDSVQFMKVGRLSTSSPLTEIEGSGEAESTTISDIIEPVQEQKILGNLMVSEEILPANNITTTENPLEGSGEGSGDGFFAFDYEDQTERLPETTTPVFEEFNPEPVHKIFENDEDINGSTTEFPIPEPPSIYQGGVDWHSRSANAEVMTEKAVTPQITRDTTVSEQIRITQASEVLGQIPNTEETVTPHKTGTYVCIALIVVLLVGLIGFAITKGQMRKRRDRRLLRQQKRDVEKASKEMVDMNKSLLGKPAAVVAPIDKKTNGRYELVPTHENNVKKNENGDVGNGIKQNDEKHLRTDSPRDTNQNKSSSKDNNLIEDPVLQQETSFDSDPASPTSGNRHSLSSEDIFVPIDDDSPRLNGTGGSDISQPLINGANDSDYLSPSREYVPVYSPDMGRVRIKMSETPKPKTPVLVTRSRSNAGDIIITPSVDGNARKSAT
ncbi:protein windpipe [Pieris rapae]|uniref:protein windpipe n=1 Tax=Pieris rapae TaxID=64459 RepID=UPI001E2800C9|nr:protein windpipe [Pieris rapae]XP_022117522.2 protein windpipe [Pieris rapae]